MVTCTRTHVVRTRSSLLMGNRRKAVTDLEEGLVVFLFYFFSLSLQYVNSNVCFFPFSFSDRLFCWGRGLSLSLLFPSSRLLLRALFPFHFTLFLLSPLPFVLLFCWRRPRCRVAAILLPFAASLFRHRPSLSAINSEIADDIYKGTNVKVHVVLDAVLSQ